MTSRNITQRNNKPTPINPLFQQQQHHQHELLSPLGSNSGTIPFSSIVPSSTTHYYNNTISTRPRAKSVGKMVDQKQLAREESFLKLCGQLTPPPLPSSSSTSIPFYNNNNNNNNQPHSPRQYYPQQQIKNYHPQYNNNSNSNNNTHRIKKYPSAHDLKKSLHQQKYNIDLHHHIPLPQSPISPNIDDDDDDIPLAMKHHKIRNNNNNHQFLSHKKTKSKSSSLLNDDQEDDDTDLIPIAKLKQKNHHHPINNNDYPIIYKSAADKYKEKVKEYLQIDPISSS